MTQANQWRQEDERERGNERRSASIERSARRSSFAPMAPAYLPTPFSLMSELMFDVDRVLRDFVGSGTGIVAQQAPARLATSAPSAFNPPLEVMEREGELVVRVDLPGLERDDIKVEIEDNRVVVSGERTQHSEDRRSGYYRSEVRYGQFTRAIALPDDANAEDARATFTKGVLEIAVPIERSEQKRRRIEVTPGESEGSEEHTEGHEGFHS